MTDAWERVVGGETGGGGGGGRGGGGGGGEDGERNTRELGAVFVLGTIVAGREAGFVLPGVSNFFLPFFFCVSFMALLWGPGGGWGGGAKDHGWAAMLT